MDPILARLDKLHNQWVAFARSQARLLVWRAREDERALIDTFVAREGDLTRAETPDLFLQLVTPWTGAGHSERLAAELRAQAAEAEVDWRHDEDLLEALRSLRTRLGELAVWLAPAEFDGDYLLWLQRLVHTAPTGVRFFVVGDGYAALVRAEPQRVLELECALDMPAAFEAITDRLSGAPDDVFRRLLMRLNALFATGDLRGAEAIAAQAIGLAKQHGWTQLVSAVQLMMGAAFSARGAHVEAVTSYREAAQVDEPTLRVVALLGGAGALFAAHAFGPALEAYLRAASTSEGALQLDAYRMAVACCEELGDRERAWAVGLLGLRVGARMSAQQRAVSTFAELVAQLQRLFAGDPRAHALNEQLARL